MTQLDAELHALHCAVEAFEAVAPDAQIRMLSYLNNRFGRGGCDSHYNGGLATGGETLRCCLVKGHGGTHVSVTGRTWTPEDLV
jgi:hypothetical protein